MMRHLTRLRVHTAVCARNDVGTTSVSSISGFPSRAARHCVETDDYCSSDIRLMAIGTSGKRKGGSSPTMERDGTRLIVVVAVTATNIVTFFSVLQIMVVSSSSSGVGVGALLVYDALQRCEAGMGQSP